MKTILFILLVVQVEYAERYGEVFLGSEDIINVWATTKTMDGGDSIAPAVAHYKAILFHTEAALNSFLYFQDVDGQILIDIRKGKQFVIHQEAIREVQQVKKEVLKGYKVKLEEHK